MTAEYTLEMANEAVARSDRRETRFTAEQISDAVMRLTQAHHEGGMLVAETMAREQWLMHGNGDWNRVQITAKARLTLCMENLIRRLGALGIIVAEDQNDREH